MRPLLWITGFPQRWCWVEVRHGQMKARMSWGFRTVVPVSAVRRAQLFEGRLPLSIGVHGWRGRWLVNGSRRGLVTIEIEPPARARVIGFPVRLRRLDVSVDEPEALVASLSR